MLISIVDNLLETVFKILDNYSLCTSCLGRQFATLLSGTTNRKRGEALLLMAGMNVHFDILHGKNSLKSYNSLLRVDFFPLQQSYPKIASSALLTPNPLSAIEEQNRPPDQNNLTLLQEKPRPCEICQGILEPEYLKTYISLILSHTQYYEFTTYLIGCTIPAEIIEREEDIRTKLNLTLGESIKSEINREVGKLTQNEQTFQGKYVDFSNPEIVFILDFTEKRVKIQNNPVFVLGRYKKLVRGIPQAVWICKNCRGKGCKECDFNGRRYPDAVEEYILPILQQFAKAKSSKFHGSGREDIDALMLGDGRPFVAELLEPKIRTLDLPLLQEKINSLAKGRVEVTLLEITNRNKVRELKSLSRRMRKKYRLKVKLPQPILINLEIAQKLVGEIAQQTPTRVVHRRADITRLREVFSVIASQPDLEHLEIEIYCEGGLYVKELIHGDQGRTKPSLSELLDMKLSVDELDVLKVEEIKNSVE